LALLNTTTPAFNFGAFISDEFFKDFQEHKTAMEEVPKKENKTIRVNSAASHSSKLKRFLASGSALISHGTAARGRFLGDLKSSPPPFVSAVT